MAGVGVFCPHHRHGAGVGHRGAHGLSLLIILYLVRKDENSAYKVGWIALIGLLPLLGGALYLAFGNKRPSRRLRSKMQAVEQAHRADRAPAVRTDRRAVR